MVRVIKRDCSEVDFDKNKISTAILKAMKNGSGIVKPKIAESVADEIEEECKDREEIDISEIEATCGYKGTARNGWNQGRLGDIHDRVEHLDDIDAEDN